MATSDITRRYLPETDLVLATRMGVDPQVSEHTDEAGRRTGLVILRFEGIILGHEATQVKLNTALDARDIPQALRALRRAYVNMPIEAR